MTITIPDDVLEATHMSEDELLQELAVTLYQQDKLSLTQAAQLSGSDRDSFQDLLTSRGIALHYDVEDLHQDVATLRELGRL
jgi:predicted HTH domain antitoxin